MGENPRLAVVTGASAGLGAAFAEKLAARGFDLLLAARRANRLEELRSRLESQHGVRVEVHAANLSDPEACGGLAARLEAAPRVDLLVNNAGFGTLGVFWETDYARQEEMHRLHIGAAMRLTRAVLPGMMARGEGGIINVSSVAAFFRSAGNVSYCATKGWMCDFSEALRLELDDAKSPVVVQALCPGFTYTEFHDVLGVSRDALGKGWWMPAEFVVEESLKGLEKGKLFVIPGWRYKLLVAVGSRLPVRLRMAMQKMSPHRGRRLKK
jgi:hypothetical protein